MSRRPGIRAGEPTAGTWRWIPTQITMHDGSVLATWGVQVAKTGEWVGRAHPIGPLPEDRVVAHANAGLFAASKQISEVLLDAVGAWSEQFDGPQDVDLNMSPTDVMDWFISWREQARAALTAAGVP